jgi:signal transduction histidine kinase
VDVAELVCEVAGACVEKLESRGVRLVVQTGDETVAVRGNRDRLRQMMEHLLNNAAQALAGVDSAQGDEEGVIRISVGRDGALVHLIVSDTGPGFREPEKVFDAMGAGGLSVCYGIVRAHGGEIRAFNLHPNGAGVAVELPVVDCGLKKSEVEGDRAYSVSV